MHHQRSVIKRPTGSTTSTTSGQTDTTSGQANLRVERQILRVGQTSRWTEEYYQLKNEYFDWDKSTTSDQASNIIT